ncbi:MAG: GTP-binding protein [Pirellulales bacterium]
MQFQKFGNRLLLIFFLAVLGFVLVYVPTKLLDLYTQARELGPVWSMVFFAVVGTGGLLLTGTAGWVVWQLTGASRRRRVLRDRQQRDPSQLSAAEKRTEIEDNLRLVSELEHDLTIPFELKEELGPLSQQLTAKQTSQRLEIVAFGTISSGKSSVLNALAGRDVFATEVRGGTTIDRNEVPWPGADSVILVDTPGLEEVEGHERAAVATSAAKDADLILMVVDGPLRESEHKFLSQLAAMEKRVIVVLNKSDWYSPSEQQRLKDQLVEQTAGLVDPLDVVTVRAEQSTRVRRVVGSDGTESDERISVPADIQPLAARMLAIVRRDGRDLLLANLLLRSRGLVSQAKQRVEEALDRRAYQIIDKYMWTAGGTAALVPFPLVDLAAGCAISSKMVVDLARVYRQEVDLAAASKMLTEFGKTALGVLGAGAAAPVVSSLVASMLKAVPGAGHVAGGLLQGIVQALITRWIGNIFVTYFKHQMQEPPGGLAQLARREWERLTTVDQLRKLVVSAKERLTEAD